MAARRRKGRQPATTDGLPFLELPTGSPLHLLEVDSLERIAAGLEPRARACEESGFLVPWHDVLRKLRGDRDLARQIADFRSLATDLARPVAALARREWAPYGPTFSVGRYLSGSTRPARRRIVDTSEVAPIRIYASCSVSRVFALKDVARRAAILVACVEAMALARPVELWAYHACTDPDIGRTWRIPDPLDLAAVGASLGPVASRGVMVRWIGQIDRGGGDSQAPRLPGHIVVPPMRAGMQPEHVVSAFRKALAPEEE